MAGCSEELTAIDIQESPAIQHRITAGSAESSNLFSIIDRDNVHGLNLTVPEDAKEVIKPWDSRESMVRWGESSVDDQMIIHIPFTQSVRVKSVVVKLGRGEICPNRLRLYVNLPNGIGFGDDSKPTQEITLYPSEHATEYPVRIAAFANVTSVSLFFSDSPSTDVSRVYYVGFKGETKRPLKEPGNKLQLPAANAADAPVDQLAERAAGRSNVIR